MPTAFGRNNRNDESNGKVKPAHACPEDQGAGDPDQPDTQRLQRERAARPEAKQRRHGSGGQQ